MEGCSLQEVKGCSPGPYIGEANQGEFISIKGHFIESGIAFIRMIPQVIHVHIGLGDLGEYLIVGKSLELL